LYLDFLAILIGSVFDGGGDAVGVGEGLGLILTVDLVGPVGSRDGHCCDDEGVVVEREEAE